MGQVFHDVGTHPHAPFREEELKNLDNAKKKHVILPAVEAIVKATPAEELNKYRDLVLPRRAERIETKRKSK